MEEHKLSCSDLSEIATIKTIEAILNKEQTLNIILIQKLAKYFNILSQVFLD